MSSDDEEVSCIETATMADQVKQIKKKRTIEETTSLNRFVVFRLETWRTPKTFHFNKVDATQING